MHIPAFYWQSNDVSTRLTATEVEDLFQTCLALHRMGHLTSGGKFKNTCQALSWQRIPIQE